MFGYIAINKPEMKFKDFWTYRAYYCGLCRVLKQDHGLSGQMTLSYDMTFLILLFTGLYEPETREGSCRCVAHPLEKHATRINCYTEYAADMNILLSYLKCQDDWKDEHKYGKRIYGLTLKKSFDKVREKYPQKVEIVEKCMAQIDRCEEKNEKNIDKAAGYFGKVMEELFIYRKDEWEPDLRQMGFYFGKFIYLMDAWDDREKDEKTGNYNPFLVHKLELDFEESSRRLLTMMMADCCRAFERLPILEHAEILRNILYGGVWARYEQEKGKKNE